VPRIDQTRAGDDPRDIARRALQAGEHLVWAGRPGPAAQPAWQLDRTSWLIAAGPFLAAVFLLWQAVDSAGSLAALLFLGAGIVMLCIALSPLAAVWRAVRRVQRTVYAITDRRLLVLPGGSSREARSFPPEDLDDPEVRERGDGRGDVIFATVPEIRQTRQGRQTRLAEAAFTDIADMQRVAREIAKLKARAPAERAPAKPVVAEPRP
jgi:hypothetical protein